jgi:hypothetical protein
VTHMKFDQFSLRTLGKSSILCTILSKSGLDKLRGYLAVRRPRDGTTFLAAMGVHRTRRNLSLWMREALFASSIDRLILYGQNIARLPVRLRDRIAMIAAQMQNYVFGSKRSCECESPVEKLTGNSMERSDLCLIANLWFRQNSANFHNVSAACEFGPVIRTVITYHNLTKPTVRGTSTNRKVTDWRKRE